MRNAPVTVRINSINAVRGPAAPVGEWYLIFSVNGQSRGWFNHSVAVGGTYPVGYKFHVETGPADRELALQVAGFEEAGGEPVVLPFVRQIIDLDAAADEVVPGTIACTTYAVDYTVLRHDRNEVDDPGLRPAPAPIGRRQRTNRVLVVSAFLALALYGAALISAAF